MNILLEHSEILIGLVIAFIILIIFLAIRYTKKQDEQGDAFLNEINKIINGKISEEKLRKRLTGAYKGRELECVYNKPQGNQAAGITLRLTPLKAPELKGIKLSLKVTDKVIFTGRFKSKFLLYNGKDALKQYQNSPNEQTIINILDELTKAADILEARPHAIPLKDHKKRLIDYLLFPAMVLLLIIFAIIRYKFYHH